MNREKGNIFAQVVESNRFKGVIIGVILVAAVLVGLETNHAIVEAHSEIFHLLDTFILYIFVGEIVIKMLAHGRKPWLYFTDTWNIFDFSIVVVCFIPTFDGHFAAVLRLARVFRVLRLVTALPRLRLIVSALLKSIPSMGYVVVLQFVLFYIYGVMAVFLFSENDPVHFRNLPVAFISLFRIVTLEGWAEIMYTNMYGCDKYGYTLIMDQCTNPIAAPTMAAVFFISFVLVGSMVFLNLFIGIVINGMVEAQEEMSVMVVHKGVIMADGDNPYPHHAAEQHPNLEHVPIENAPIEAQLVEIRQQLRYLIEAQQKNWTNGHHPERVKTS